MPTAPTGHPVSVRGLSKDYGDVHAVRDISLDIHRGEVFALLGPNGAGKTTTVDILTGVRQRTSGDVRGGGGPPPPAPPGGGGPRARGGPPAGRAPAPV
ncbi:ATP-binding cassette domain-containing protein, partial [Streptomyces sp. NPDC054829]